MRRLAGAFACGAVGVLVAGCAHTVGGTAQPADRGGGATPGGGLDAVLLNADEVNTIMAATGIRVVEASQDMQSTTENVSRPDCLGALYNAEDSVYQGSGWTDVRDQVLQEPGDDNAHWVEQTAVGFPGAGPAQAFVGSSLSSWSHCSGKEVALTSGADVTRWEIGDLIISGRTINQTALQQGAGGWGCQHALSAVSAVVIEATACSNDVADQAVTIVDEMSANVS
ncbi:sensor domain-containing protein [Mycobacterium sp.]|uniref:sensor domain-containing protein n=1 Tax=Mycobacterium sp. TaxID=1785 RepID=UPI002BB15273|nr:sensor domain-containing protein [Mycobacterium sp.]HME50296.1 sensor domain-containing protein [Mycobacterium sp.]